VIEKQTTTVWYSPTRRRRFFTKNGAIHAEAVALIYKKNPSYPSEDDEFGRCTYRGYNIKYDEPERFETMVRRMEKIIKNAGYRFDNKDGTE